MDGANSALLRQRLRALRLLLLEVPGAAASAHAEMLAETELLIRHARGLPIAPTEQLAELDELIAALEGDRGDDELLHRVAASVHSVRALAASPRPP